MDTEQLLHTATERHRAGDLPEARRLYGEVLRESPGHATALFRSGLLELAERRTDAALVLIARAAEQAPHEARHHIGLGQVLQALARHEAAAAAYRRALQLDPTDSDTHFALGVALQSSGDESGAAAAYEAVLVAEPARADALNNLGIALLALGRHGEAVARHRAAFDLRPSAPGYAVNLGIALCAARDFAAAEQVLRELSAREPEDATAHFNHGLALHGLGRLREAQSCYARALALRADYADALNNLGNVCKELGEFSEAVAAYEAAIGLRPEWPLALNNAGCLLRSLGRLDEAEALLERAIQASPGSATLHDNLGSVRKDAGDLDGAIACFRRALALEPHNAVTHSNLVYALSFQAAEPEPILAEARRWNDRFAAALTRAALTRAAVSRAAARTPAAQADAAEAAHASAHAHAHAQDPGRRLKIGYVSADFRDHCQSLFMLPLLSHHDRSRFEIHAYSSVERPDFLTERIAGLVSVWRDVRRTDDDALADIVRGDGIDILVDLTMHMAHGRPLVFARKPAPCQVAWLAYPGTTGLDALDWRLSDPRLDPQDYDAHYNERTLRLPDSFWCYDALSTEPEPGSLPAASRGYVTFGCLNNPCKLTDASLQLWSPVLSALPDSRLVLLAREGSQRARLTGRFAALGVQAERLQYLPFQPRDAYLKAYRDIDIGLDTIPYNGHTTSLDSLWMGVPVVSRIGRTCVGRAGLSQLHQIGLAGLAADSDAGFTAAAVALAHDLPRLADLRRGLRQRLEASPLMDGARFARHVEAAYRTMWREFRLRSS
jgi:predicted O-linked N-acetylglucosamine transferase (SPINDLY family)